MKSTEIQKFAKQYLNNSAHPTSARHFLLTLPRHQGILCLLDQILDYLPFKDLERLIFVSKFFLFCATLEKLYQKYNCSREALGRSSSSPHFRSLRKRESSKST
mmetsp:Transcript_18592/g.21363  ORF Transcript_18592/g.21363 Transcript_18592/m.21363 type:complete len:104 (-) Transcript_18592:871-1182(-)